jgi:hypothetical protein
MTLTSSRFWRGAWYGLLGTIAMTVVMLLFQAAGVIPEPVYLSVLARILSRTHEITTPALIAAVPFHLIYGSLWGGLATITSLEMNWWKGLVLGFGMWLIMLVFVVPFTVGYGFELVYKPSIWVSTLLMHLVYGFIVGGLAGRHEPLEAHATSLG